MINLDKIIADQINSTFQVGRTYWTRSAWDYDCIFLFQILARTPTSVIVNDVHGKQVRRGVTIRNGVERFNPFGSGFTNVVITADRVHSEV